MVDQVLDDEAAEAFGVADGQVVVMIHSGSRGFGHQTCTDHLARMNAPNRLGFELPDRQLACAPVGSPEGRDYLAAMACACNFAFANRQVMMNEVSGALEQVFRASRERLGVGLVYDVAHNIAKRETHVVDGASNAPCWVHRKGATRAFGPGRPDVPADYRDVGQPVIIPGDMGRESWLLAGTETAMRETFGSTCHGAGRLLSRGAARKVSSGPEVRRELEEQGIVVHAASIGAARRGGALRLQGRGRGRGRRRGGRSVAPRGAPQAARRAQGLATSAAARGCAGRLRRTAGGRAFRRLGGPGSLSSRPASSS